MKQLQRSPNSAGRSSEVGTLKEVVAKELKELFARRKRVTVRMVLDLCKLSRPFLHPIGGGGAGGADKSVGGTAMDTIAAEFFPGYKTLEELLTSMGIDVPKVCNGRKTLARGPNADRSNLQGCHSQNITGGG